MSLTSAAVIATGGDSVEDIDGYRIHKFTTTGSSSFVVTRGGPVEVLVVAGGGGGGGIFTSFAPGGGGGAGELIYRKNYSISGVVFITVGDGGFGGSNNAPIFQNSTNGQNSIFGDLIAIGGGRGGGDSNGGGGGSGGGGSRGWLGGASIAVTGFGNAGGKSIGDRATGTANGGGGGGAGGQGLDSYNNSIKTPGGGGLSYNISGISKTYATGGRGGQRDGSPSASATVPMNTGDGGNGASTNRSIIWGSEVAPSGSNGGSGIVIVRYPIGMVWTGKETIPREIFKYNYPLDSATSVVGAYSFRKLIGSYQGPMIRLIRQSDLTNMDFVGDNFGNLSNVQTGLSASTWIGGSSANVSIWYDQSSAVNHAPYTSDNSYGLPPPFSLTDGIYFQNQNFTTSTTYYYGLKLGTAKTIQACLCNFNLKSGKTNDTAWNSLVAASVDNAGVRLFGTPGSLQIGDRNDLLTTGCYTIFDGVYNSPTSGNFFINSFDVPHKMFANRTVEPYTRGAMLYIGTANPSNSDTLKRRSFYGYMSELVLFSGSVNSSTALTYMV
jgi:hypothetical protein